MNGELVDAVARLLCLADPTTTDRTWAHLREEARDHFRTQARGLLACGVAPQRCSICDDYVVWHEGNGGQWLGLLPGRDWMSCGGYVNGTLHEVKL